MSPYAQLMGAVHEAQVANAGEYLTTLSTLDPIEMGAFVEERKVSGQASEAGGASPDESQNEKPR